MQVPFALLGEVRCVISGPHSIGTLFADQEEVVKEIEEQFRRGSD